MLNQRCYRVLFLVVLPIYFLRPATFGEGRVGRFEPFGLGLVPTTVPIFPPGALLDVAIFLSFLCYLVYEWIIERLRFEVKGGDISCL